MKKYIFLILCSIFFVLLTGCPEEIIESESTKKSDWRDKICNNVWINMEQNEVLQLINNNGDYSGNFIIMKINNSALSGIDSGAPSIDPSTIDPFINSVLKGNFSFNKNGMLVLNTEKILLGSTWADLNTTIVDLVIYTIDDLNLDGINEEYIDCNEKSYIKINKDWKSNIIGSWTGLTSGMTGEMKLEYFNGILGEIDLKGYIDSELNFGKKGMYVILSNTDNSGYLLTQIIETYDDSGWIIENPPLMSISYITYNIEFNTLQIKSSLSATDYNILSRLE